MTLSFGDVETDDLEELGAVDEVGNVGGCRGIFERIFSFCCSTTFLIKSSDYRIVKEIKEIYCEFTLKEFQHRKPAKKYSLFLLQHLWIHSALSLYL